ncbi:hypothetical protein X777_07851 [Ooceraea biroi]|uniref:Uncharacterized protein n=2 Tax=Ooceraea biroi TaxID=2015173 RepID=A0A026X0A3_OOCBI|nr:hypothetical protein X777_07851 [Ooceraea biroi]
MDEETLQLAQEIARQDEKVPRRNAVSKMHDKQRAFSNVQSELTVDHLKTVQPRR